MLNRVSWLSILLSAAISPAFGQSVIAQIPAPGVTTGVAVNPLSNRVYVASISSSEESRALVSLVDKNTRTVLNTLALGFDTPGRIMLNPVTQKIYMQACNFLKLAEPVCDLLVLNGSLDTILADLPDTGPPLAIDPGLNRVYIPNAAGYAVLDGKTDQVIGQIDLPGGGAVAIDISRHRLYSIVNGSKLAVVDLRANRVRKLKAIEPNAELLAINPLTHRAYITHPDFETSNPSKLTVLDLDNFHVRAHIPVAPAPRGVFVDVRANIIFVADDSGLTAIDGASNRITTAIPQATSAEPDLATGLVYATTSLVFFDDLFPQADFSGRVDVIQEPARRHREDRDRDRD